MKRTGRIQALAGALGMALLILDSRTALSGADQGIQLCLQAAIPSLFPFFVLSQMLTSALTGSSLPLLRPVLRLLRIPEGGESFLLVGLLGGYPVGAAGIAEAVRRGQLSQKTARRMLGFCNNAGPSFLFGIVAGAFPDRWMAWALRVIHILSALAVAFLLPGEDTPALSIPPLRPLSFPDCVSNAVKTMASVCGWIVLFRVLIAFLDRWFFWAIPKPVTVLISGLLELTNGCTMLRNISNVGLRFLVCSGLLAFGGLCVAMQTVSVTENVGSGLYFPGKLLQTTISLGLAALTQTLFADSWHFPLAVFLLPAIVVLVILFFTLRAQKRSSIPAEVGV